MSRKTTQPPDSLQAPSTYAERLAFVVWYALLERGIEGATKLSLAIGKPENALSKWAKKQPGFDQSAALADAVGINATWLHNPASSGAVEPELFPKWLRSVRLAAKQGEKEPTTSRRGA